MDCLPLVMSSQPLVIGKAYRVVKSPPTNFRNENNSINKPGIYSRTLEIKVAMRTTICQLVIMFSVSTI